MSHVGESSLEKGKTIIRLKGVKIAKQDFSLKVDVFQDSLLEVCLVILIDMTLGRALIESKLIYVDEVNY